MPRQARLCGTIKWCFPPTGNCCRGSRSSRNYTRCFLPVFFGFIKSSNMNLILASKSPRRQELLRGMGFSFEILLRETDESYPDGRSEEHTSELQSLMRSSYAVFCLKKKKQSNEHQTNKIHTYIVF